MAKNEQRADYDKKKSFNEGKKEHKGKTNREDRSSKSSKNDKHEQDKRQARKSDKKAAGNNVKNNSDDNKKKSPDNRGKKRFGNAKENRFDDSKGSKKTGRVGDFKASGKEKGVKKVSVPCPVYRKCGGCQLLEMTYEQQLRFKQKEVEGLLKEFCAVEPIIGMKEPYHYRNKVSRRMGFERGKAFCGIYEEHSHRVVPVEQCLIEDEQANRILKTICELVKSFKYRVYDEDSGYGLIRHILIRKGFTTGEVMVVLVLASPILPSKNNFVTALRKAHPEISTVLVNVNSRGTSMVLGEKEKVLYGKGYIEDVLCGLTFRISSKSFYQVNPVQTERLYSKAIELAGLTGKETVVDAYCGIGTIGLIASRKAAEVIGVELNRDAVRDAVANGKRNGVKNCWFYQGDAGEFMDEMSASGKSVDVVLMDPPRSGSDERFLGSVVRLGTGKIVYVSCNAETLKRDLGVLVKAGYLVKKVQPVDMFCWTGHVETVVLLTKQKS